MISGIIEYKNGIRGNFSLKHWLSLQEMANKEKNVKNFSLFYDLKNLDSQIRIFEAVTTEDNKFYWICEVGLYESLGEQGEIRIFTFQTFPKLKEIREEIIEHLNEAKEELENNCCLTAREEGYMGALSKIKCL